MLKKSGESHQLTWRTETREMWFHRRVLDVVWTEDVSNEDVLRNNETKIALVLIIGKGLLKFLGHNMRKENVENSSLTEDNDGRRGSEKHQ